MPLQLAERAAHNGTRLAANRGGAAQTSRRDCFECKGQGGQ